MHSRLLLSWPWSTLGNVVAPSFKSRRRLSPVYFKNGHFVRVGPLRRTRMNPLVKL